MTSRIVRRLRHGPSRRSVPDDIEAALIAPLYGGVGSLALGQVCGIVAAAVAVLRLTGRTTEILLLLHILIFAIRMVLLLHVRRLTDAGDTQAARRLFGAYCVSGVGWSLLLGVSAALYTAIDPNDFAGIFSIEVICGACGGLASRNASAPRFALSQIITMMLPVIIACAYVGGPILVQVIVLPLCAGGLAAIVRRQCREVTTLLLTERSNRTLAAQFDAAISNMSQGLLLFGNDNRLQVVNRRFRDLFALPAETLSADATLEQVAACCALFGLDGEWTHPAQAVGRFACLGQTTTGGVTEIRDLPDGRAIAINEQRLASGGRVITFEDFTERRKADLAIVEREAELRAMFANAAAGVAESDYASGAFTQVNAAFCQLVGHSEESLLDGMTLSDLIPAATRSDQREAAERGEVFNTEVLIRRPDGRELWTRCRTSVTRLDRQAKPVRLVSEFHDITERKAAELSLRSSNELLRLSMAAGKIGEYRFDLTAKLIYCDAGTRAIHGLPVADGPIAESAWRRTLLPEDSHQVIRHIASCYERRAQQFTVEYRFRRPDEAEIRYAEIRASVAYDTNGKPREQIGVLIDVTERRQAQARIAHLAHHDPLTGLPNRSLFQIRLEDALARARRGGGFTLCYIDLDHFKEVNDTLGHPAGDALLRAVTERLRGELRDTDTIARLGGDEFAIIQAGPCQSDDIPALCTRLIAEVSAPYDIDGHTVTIGASIGITVAPEDGLDPDQLLKNADMALYRAKLEGRGRTRRFEIEMDTQLRARLAIERDLKLAVEHEEFELFYQPLIDVATRRVTGLEALIRWRHTRRGLVAPDAFISLVEANGLIQPIGAWALREACRQMVLWPEVPRVAVNLSVAQFPNPNLVDDVAVALRESGLNPARLELEITETVMLQDTDATLSTLHRLKALGVRIALDDFGTGYSSLSYLQSFPFDKVKIDRAFVANLGLTAESSTIMRAMIDLCRALGMSTLAEGVETETQLRALAAEGCKEVQGYYFSSPLPAAEIPGLMAMLAADADTFSDQFADAYARAS